MRLPTFVRAFLMDDTMHRLESMDTLKSRRKERFASIGRGRVEVGPQTVHIDLANGCNTNCTTCWDHSPLLDHPRSIEWKRQSMPFERFDELTDDLAGMESVEAVILSGMGDPFVNPDIYRCIEKSKRLGWHVTVLTNALLADPVRIVDLDVDSMLVSVNGVSPRSYTRFHPNLQDRDFERLQELLAYWSDRGKRFKHVQVINRDTADELPQMIEFAAQFDAAHVTFKLASLRNGTEACAIEETQRANLLRVSIPEARIAAAYLDVQTNLDVFELQLRSGGLTTSPIEDVGCFMGWFYSRVTVDGRILFCCSTQIDVGHLDEGKFSSHWFGDRWTAVRNRLMEGEYFSSCAQCGKLNQNVKIGRKVREKLGDALYLERTGRGETRTRYRSSRSLPVINM